MLVPPVTKETTHQTRTYANLSSLRTSCTEGTASPVPGGRLQSNKETVNDLASLQANKAPLRRNQAASILPWRLRSTLCARPLARAQELGSLSLQRPPTSAANTTSRVLPYSPVTSGYVSSFLFRAASSAAPSWLAALLLATPFRLSGETRVVQGQPIRHNFESSTVQGVKLC